MNKKVVTLLSVMAVSTLALSACGGGSSKKTAKDTPKEELKLPHAVSNKDKAIEGGTLDIAVVNDAPFQGLFSPAFNSDNYDYCYAQPTGFGSLFSIDENFKLTNDGVASFKYDKESKTATVTLKDGIKWSDGKPLTSDDLIYTYKVVADKDYDGVRYSDIINIEGVEDYHAGKAKEISGLKQVDDKTIEIKFLSNNPGVLQGADFLTYAIPKHQLEKIPVAKMSSSPEIREHPLSFGPYVISKVVTGESVELVPNEHYYGNKPKLKKIVETNVSSKTIIESMKAKKYDYIYQMPTDTYTKYKDIKGYEMLGKVEMAYTYLGFKLGKYNEEKSQSDYNPEAKMANKELRQAMGYAVDNDAVGKKFYNGLRENANALIIPPFKDFHASKEEVPGYSLNEKKAKELLDKAGYKDTDNDGLREDPKGNKLEIKFASMSGGETAQPLADYYIQQWKKIGLNVTLSTGRLLDFQSFYDKVQHDDPEIDVYQAAWSTGSNPEPSGLWGPKAQYNYTRFVSEENTKLIEEINSEKAFDEAYRKEKFIEWQKYAAEEAFAIPTLYRWGVTPVSERVVGVDITSTITLNELWEKVGVSKESR
ncbi:peptide/nickel transport system substrate-binding protein [Pilibacter termitis]|uniref:Peptide/nickel transport system substrate-binding protein n=1 Tax=Pilibacter termitis TaxID=263852 RepID=A0A1T4P7G3_9ENTE|nr:oligopeptide ABC transporter substrate-binding protein [Pilibacter termitis]SJZ87483.1 peptide/nickel transport system substrate-binding protein [Pilibacter termitis]